MISFKESLRQGKIAPAFCLARLVHPVLVDMVAAAGGYHGLWLDGEHARLSSEQVATIALAARANQLDTFVRMAPTNYSDVTQMLEAGAGGVMAAQIQSVSHAQEFVSWCRFPPAGVRGLNTSGADARYTHLAPAEFVAASVDRALIGIQIETLGALQDVDSIASVDGVDLLFVGPSDLSMALGVVGQFHSDQLWNAIERVAMAAQRNDIAWGAVLPDATFATRAMQLGCQLPTYGNDSAMIRRGVEALRTTFDF